MRGSRFGFGFGVRRRVWHWFWVVFWFWAGVSGSFRVAAADGGGVSGAEAGLALGPGDHARSLVHGGLTRTFLIHVPPGCDGSRPTPVVLMFHGLASTGPMMASFTGLSETADAKGFVVVYPNGTGLKGGLLTAAATMGWNAGGWRGPGAEDRPDDVGFTRALLDELPKYVNVDAKRVYATGMSNGGMMCHRLALELSDRIAAFAPVAGTLTRNEGEGELNPKRRPTPILQFHGTEDPIVKMGGADLRTALFLNFRGVEESVEAWARANGCEPTPLEEDLPDVDPGDGTTVRRRWYRGPGGDARCEVGLYLVKGGGHTWPGRRPPLRRLGKSTMDVSANEAMWEFFERHPLP